MNTELLLYLLSEDEEDEGFVDDSLVLSSSTNYSLNNYDYGYSNITNSPSRKSLNYWGNKITNYTPFVSPTNKMKFTIDDYLNAGSEPYTKSTIQPQALNNASNLIEKINDLGNYIDYNNIITSGYRSPERQRQIYEEKGEKPAMGSKHLSGHAVDIFDPKGELKNKILNTEVLRKANDLGLYFENFGMTPTWVHIQDEKPGVTGRQIWSANNLLAQNGNNNVA